jgi:hypothetical protein
MVCLGLRKPDLLRIYLKDSNGLFYNTLKIYERKNKHISYRYLPDSLCQLFTVSSCTLPLTIPRMDRMREYCIKKFGRFYGLRAVCLTTITSAIFEQTAFAQFHLSPNTTNKYYLNK